MSLLINTDDVTEVLLADGWHDVLDASFDIDSYEFGLNERHVVHRGGQSGICAAGFMFWNRDGVYYGPLTSVLAVKTQGSDE